MLYGSIRQLHFVKPPALACRSVPPPHWVRRSGLLRPSCQRTVLRYPHSSHTHSTYNQGIVPCVQQPDLALRRCTPILVESHSALCHRPCMVSRCKSEDDQSSWGPPVKSGRGTQHHYTCSQSHCQAACRCLSLLLAPVPLASIQDPRRTTRHLTSCLCHRRCLPVPLPPTAAPTHPSSTKHS